MLVFSHDDIEILSPDFGERLAGHLGRHDIVGVAGTTRLIGGGWYFAGDPFVHMLVITPNRDTGQLVMHVAGGGPLVVPGIQAFDGLFFATRASVARSLRFDAETFDHFHLYDLDFSYRAWIAGLRLAVCRDLVLIHHSHGNYDDRWNEYRARFERKFAGRLDTAMPRRDPTMVKVPLGAAVMEDPAEVARLCRPETLARFVAAVPNPSSFNNVARPS